MKIDHIVAVTDPSAELIGRLEGAIALSKQTGQGISNFSLEQMLAAAKLASPAPARSTLENFTASAGIDAISANANTSAKQKQGLRSLLARHGIQVPGVGQGLSHTYLNSVLAPLSTSDRLLVKTALVENNLVSLNAA